MATIVRDIISGAHFVLLGAGYGVSNSDIDGMMPLGYSNADAAVLAVSDSDGQIHVIPSNRLTVISVDDQTCKDLLSRVNKPPSSSQ